MSSDGRMAKSNCQLLFTHAGIAVPKYDATAPSLWPVYGQSMLITAR